MKNIVLEKNPSYVAAFTQNHINEVKNNKQFVGGTEF